MYDKNARHLRYMKNKEHVLLVAKKYKESHPEVILKGMVAGIERRKIERALVRDKYGLGAGTISRYGFRLALKIYDKFGRRCSECGEIDDLTLHHLDHNGSNLLKKGLKPNNDEDNLLLICRRCHGKIHGKEHGKNKRQPVEA